MKVAPVNIFPIKTLHYTVACDIKHVMPLVMSSFMQYILYKIKIWHRIYFGSLMNYENPPN